MVATRAANLSSRYLGQVATRTGFCNSFFADHKESMSRVRHIARDNITSLQLVIPNWYVVPWEAEYASGATATVTASVEYPAGTFTQVKFSGSVSGSIVSGSNITSDAVTIAIPYGAAFWTRIWYSNSAGIVYVSIVGVCTGDGFKSGPATTVVDKTMGGTVDDSGGTIFMPAALIAYTRRSSLYLLGDSRVVADHDTGDATTNYGMLARSVGTALPYINGSVSGDSIYNAGITYTKRSAFLQYCSHVICLMGINDIVTGGLAGSVVAGLLPTLFAQLSSKPIWMCTIAPVSTSSDSWATTTNQTTHATNAERVAFNNLIRAGIAGTEGYFELADVVESARDSGKWKAPGPYTDDGIHGLRLADMACQASGIVNPGWFQR
jgi:hypothetical protein